MRDQLWAAVFHNRNLLAGLPLLYALVSSRGRVDAGWAVWLMALLLCLAGLALRGWSFSHCSYRQGVPTHLAVTGPYASCRNPVYIGNMLLMAGATVASGLLWLVLPLLGWAWLVYHGAVTYEERKRLVKRYGDPYRRYCAEVPRWIPRRIAPSGAWRGEARRGFLRVALGEWRTLLILLPFVLKALDPFGLWPGGS